MLDPEQVQAAARRYAALAYADSPATSDSETITDAVAAVDGQVEQASAQWLAALPGQFAQEASTDQKRTLIAVVIAARNGLV
jgi:mitochondrial fission protein ELM1